MKSTNTKVLYLVINMIIYSFCEDYLNLTVHHLEPLLIPLVKTFVDLWVSDVIMWSLYFFIYLVYFYRSYFMCCIGSLHVSDVIAFDRVFSR